MAKANCLFVNPTLSPEIFPVHEQHQTLRSALPMEKASPQGIYNDFVYI